MEYVCAELISGDNVLVEFSPGNLLSLWMIYSINIGSKDKESATAERIVVNELTVCTACNLHT